MHEDFTVTGQAWWASTSLTLAQPKHGAHSARAGMGTVLGHAWAASLAHSAGTSMAPLMGWHYAGPIPPLH